jgi:hypothetical protein
MHRITEDLTGRVGLAHHATHQTANVAMPELAVGNREFVMAERQIEDTLRGRACPRCMTSASPPAALASIRPQVHAHHRPLK